MDKNTFNAAIAFALNDRDSKGRFHEPHELRRALKEILGKNNRWALRVLQVVIENSGKPTPAPVAHWVTYGRSMYAAGLADFVKRIAPTVAAGALLAPEDQARLTDMSIKYSKQAVARMLLDA